MAPALRDRSFADEPVKVSICCIAYNHGAYIARTLQGFLDQRCDFRVEVVIYDDASTDDTAAVIADHAARHPTIFRTMLQGENLFSKGVNPYFAHVFPAARGNFIAICDGDDYWDDPDKLALQVAALESDPALVLTYGAVQGVDDAGAPLAYVGGVEQDLTGAELKRAPSINTLTAVFRNIFRGKPVPLYIRTATIGDLMVWGMLGHHGGGRFLRSLKPAHYRLRAGGLISMQGREQQIMLTAVAQMHLAAWHADQGDRAASEDCLRAMAFLFNATGRGRLDYTGPDGASPPPPRKRGYWEVRWLSLRRKLFGT